MANQNPTITSSAATGSFSENSNTTDSSALHLLSGTMSFKDGNKTDTHTTSASLKSAVLSSGTIIPADTLAHLNAAMSSTILVDHYSNGKLKWSFGAADEDFDFLAKNQKLTLTYEIVLRDNHGGTTKKTVTITVTGTDDKPVIDFGVSAVVTEQAGKTLSLSPDVANIAVHFVDPDLTNTGHTASVIDVSASGATGGLLLGESMLMAFFHINNVVKPSGSSNGTINTTFSAPDLVFDYLAAGETLDIVYTIRLNDNAGMTSTQTVTVTVVGTNDGPHYLSGPDMEHLVEGEGLSPAGDLTACGDFLFADIDLSDSHTVSATATATRSGGGAVPLTEAQLIAALTTEVDPDSTGQLLGEVDWSFALDNDDVSFLDSGETLTITYTVTITDDAGGADTQTITVKILGTNDPVIVTSGPEAVSIVEFADVTGSPDPNPAPPATGAVTFTDTDLGDTHTVNVTVAAATWSGGGSVPAATGADLAGALVTTLNDSTGTGSGSVDWSFSIPDFDLDFLAAGETLTVEYNVEVRDGSTGDSQTVTITVDGANDLPLIISGPGSGAVDEQPNQSGSPTPSAPVTGSLSFTDVDLNDTHTIQVVVASAVWSRDPDFIVGGQTAEDLMTALSTILNDSTGSGAGSIDWSFSIPDADLDFLAAGETLTVTYDVTLSDGFASATQTVVITLNGAADDLIVNPVAVTAFDSAALDVDQIIAAGNVITDVLDSGGDMSTTLSVSAVNGNPGNVGTIIAGVYGSLLILEDGFYQYIAGAGIDALQEGESLAEQFTFTVTDSLGRSEETTLDITIQGGNDAPAITGGILSGQMSEDLGPTVLVNGGFETGSASGWTVIGDHIIVDLQPAGPEFGVYAVRLGATTTPVPDDTEIETLFQDIATTAGAHYIVSFYLAGDQEGGGNSFTVTWDGATIFEQFNTSTPGFTQYTFEVVASGPTTQLAFSYFLDGVGMYLDQIAVESVAGTPTQSADGNVTFADIEVGDTHTASFIEAGGGYLGTFSLGTLTESGGAGSVDWSFTVDNDDIQFLSQGQSYSQTYTVFVTDDHGASAVRDVTVTVVGTNDAPTTVGDDTVVTNADIGGAFFIPSWALTLNDTDPDMLDTLHVNSVTGGTGGGAFAAGGIIFFEDGVLGGTVDYDTSDGALASTDTGTITILNTPGSLLTGTAGNDIIVATMGGETLDGGAGNDILLGGNGAHDLTGGLGDDIFGFDTVPNALNTITDFDNAIDHDLVAISASAFGGGLTAGMDASGTFESSSDAEYFGVGNLFHYDFTSRTLYFSADGSTASAIVVAQFQGGVFLQGTDLMIV